MRVCQCTHHGAWTQEFLINGLCERVGSGEGDLTQLSQDARSKYVKVHRQRGDQPCFFARVDGHVYNTEEASNAAVVLPPHTFGVREWIGLL